MCLAQSRVSDSISAIMSLKRSEVSSPFAEDGDGEIRIRIRWISVMCICFISVLRDLIRLYLMAYDCEDE